jgi:hypothetical protein
LGCPCTPYLPVSFWVKGLHLAQTYIIAFGALQTISPGPRAPTSLPSRSTNRISQFAITVPEADRGIFLSRTPL